MERRSRRVISATVAAVLVQACAQAAPEPPFEPSRATRTDGPAPATTATEDAGAAIGRVVEGTDGDTFDVRVGGRVERVRLIGINAPEQGECLSDAATARLSELLRGGPVR